MFDPTEIYKKALSLWGTDLQIDMMIEECAEVIHALQKFKRHRVDMMDVAMELADIEIMCGQMRIVFGDRDIEECKAYKLKRLGERIKRTRI